MNKYRTHTCGELRVQHVGQTATVSGWIHRKRDHGGILFLDLRDTHGLTQVVILPSSAGYALASETRRESVVKVTGKVKQRSADTVNAELSTGEVEVHADAFEVLGPAEPLPFAIAEDQDIPEDQRLKYRFLDLRRSGMHAKMKLRARVLASLRHRMTELGFVEFQTPILTSSSPEGARDYLVPSRLYPGKFYALPQAPQQFKQLLMVAGFDRYFQIAPCFRDESSRADRSPGEFYQLDVEMSFVTQDDVFAVFEEVMSGLFSEFSDWAVTKPPFPRITYKDAMLRYGSDKPDLRFELEIKDVSEFFRASSFQLFRRTVEGGGAVRVLAVPGMADKPRSFFDGLERFIKTQGGKGLAYLLATQDGAQGSIAAALGADATAQLKAKLGVAPGTALFFIADKEPAVSTLAGRLRVKLADELDLREKNAYRFCWIVDFPMYEWDDQTKSVIFSHNPFSMPQGGMEALEKKNPLEILAYQYDIVCNGIELSSGAIRNHRPDVMYKAFAIAGYPPEVVDQKFGGMIRAFRYGAPPHGGLAPGVDRIIMLLSQETSIREIIAFPMNQSAQDLMMGAPSEVTPKQLEELHLMVKMPPEEPAK
jgi:aspartyl-tRNA synthetase